MAFLPKLLERVMKGERVTLPTIDPTRTKMNLHSMMDWRFP
jgi:hypothetical protein